MPSKQQKNFLALNYDKLILAASVLLLALSGGLFWSRAQSRQQDVEGFKRDIANLRPKNPTAARLDGKEFDLIAAAANNPLALSTNLLMLVAPERMECINEECRKPIPSDAEICPYCKAEQPTGVPPKDWDSDGDGMTDEWEDTHGFNKFNKDDATGDPDGDGFTNLEEFKGGTDPRDPESHPALLDFLRVRHIEKRPFPYRLRGKSRGLNDNYTFQLNDLGGRTYTVRTGQVMKALAPWSAKSYSFKETILRKEGVPDRKVDVATLILTDGKEEVALVEGAGPLFNTYVVTFTCPKQVPAKDIIVQQKQEFEFDGAKFTIIAVAGDDSNRVKIKRIPSGEEIVVPAL